VPNCVTLDEIPQVFHTVLLHFRSYIPRSKGIQSYR
jgi:hypothetical protein